MTTGIAHVTDKNFRITIPEEIREVEGIKQGDYVQIDITRVDLKRITLESIVALNKKLDELPVKIAEAIKAKNGD